MVKHPLAVKRFLFALAVFLAALGARSVRAQDTARAASEDRARMLAREAVESFREGEAAGAAEDKLRAYRKGEELAEKAVKLDPASAEAHWALFANRGRRLLSEGATPNPFALRRLQKELEQCLALDPRHYDALVARGGLYRQLPWLLGGNLKKAEKTLRRAVAINPEAVGGRLELARTYIDMGNRRRAVEVLEEALFWAERLGRPKETAEARALLYEVLGEEARDLVPPECPAAPQPVSSLARTF